MGIDEFQLLRLRHGMGDRAGTREECVGRPVRSRVGEAPEEPRCAFEER